MEKKKVAGGGTQQNTANGKSQKKSKDWPDIKRAKRSLAGILGGEIDKRKNPGSR